MNRRKLLRRLTDGALGNVSFGDMINLVEGFGFHLVRVRGSHHVYSCTAVTELIVLQDVRGEAKPYQIR